MLKGECVNCEDFKHDSNMERRTYSVSIYEALRCSIKTYGIRGGRGAVNKTATFFKNCKKKFQCENLRC
jgi:hypothetical protein